MLFYGEMLFPARKMGVNPCNVAMRWSEPRFFCTFTRQKNRSKRDRQMITEYSWNVLGGVNKNRRDGGDFS